nr:ISL3 family transposase [Ktedonobacteraceae bacterium]
MLPFTFAGFEIQHIASSENLLTITARALTPTSACPSCGQASTHVHSYYTRSPQDLPVSGRRVQLVLRVRRFRCQNRQCPQRTFAERLPELPVSSRQTTRLGTLLDCIAVVLSGQAGSRLTEQLAMPVSADTLLRRAKKKTPTLPTPRILGVDDFAFRRGHTYGTILINLETHQPVDLLEDRSAETFAEWLRQHPGVEIISRDRSKDYQRGATDGAPQAQQVIDRWHLLKNLREAIERFLSHTQMPEEISEDAGLASSPRQKRTSGERARSEGSRKLRLELYQQVNELYRQGGTILGIARQLHIGHRRVRNFVRSPQFPEWGKPARTSSAIDPYRTYLQERWQQGCQETGLLWQELQARGFTGSRMMVYRWIQVQRERPASAPAQRQHQVNKAPQSMAPRHLTWLFLRAPEQLDPQEKQTLSLIRISPQVEMVYGLVQRFITLLKERNAQLLDTWLCDCQQSGISDLVTFAQGLEKEGSALHAAFTLSYSNGPVEGKINKLKYIKRSMYGRSGFPLLRQKVLKAA